MTDSEATIRRGDIRKAIRAFGRELPRDEGFRLPPSYGVVIGRELDERGRTTFEPYKTLRVGEHGFNCAEGALAIAGLAVSRRETIDGYVSLDGRGVAVSGFEELNSGVARAILDQVVLPNQQPS